MLMIPLSSKHLRPIIIIGLSLITFCVWASIAHPAHAQRQYDADGTYHGTIKMEGGRLVERNADGSMVGYWIERGGMSLHYDAD